MENAPDVARESFFREIIRFGLIAVLIVLPIRLFVAQPFVVNGASMEPTFENGDYLIINEISYHVGDPARGDVVVFRYPKDPAKYFIKRIVGLPGETVAIRNGDVLITKGGETFELQESYVKNLGNGGNMTRELGEDEYFVLGDNRPASSDSRAWGVLPRANVVGTPLIRLFPVTELQLLPGSVRSTP